MIKQLFLLIIIESLVGEQITFPTVSNEQNGLSDWWTLSESGQIEIQKLYRNCQNINMFFAFKPSSTFIGRIQLPPHKKELKISFLVWIANIYNYADFKSIDVYINDQRVYQVTSVSLEKIDCKDKDYHYWTKNTVSFEHNSSFESLVLIVKNNLIQPQQEIINDKTILWGISDFVLQFEPCQLMECSNEGWVYSLRQFFDLGLGYQQIINKNNYNNDQKVSIQLQPNYKKKVQFMLIIPDQIVDGFQFRITSQNGHILWNKIFQRFDNIKERMFLMVPVQFGFERSEQQDLIYYVQTNAKQIIGIRDLLIYIGPCQDYCLTCTSSIDCSACKFGYKYVNGKCIPNIHLKEESFQLLHESYINLNLLDPDNKWAVNNEVIKYKNSEFISNGLIVFAGKKMFNPMTQLTYRSKFGYEYITHIFYAEFYIQIRVLENLPIMVIEQFLIKQNIKDKAPEKWKCNFNDQKTSEIIHKDINLTEMMCYLEFEIEDWDYNYDQYELLVYPEKPQNPQSKYSWGIRNIRIIGKLLKKNQCALVFTQIHYNGEEYSICGNIKNFNQQQISENIKSIKIPPGGKLTLYSQNQYGGKSYVFYQDTPIIEDDLLLGHPDKIKHNTLEF